MKLRRWQLMVPLEPPVISLMAERMEVEKRTFHGRCGLVSEAMVAMTLIKVEKGERGRLKGQATQARAIGLKILDEKKDL
ncbi:hypothetical protein MTR_6g065425 [Medicago truncatula]|uniref:Uncharacterized protein n=1 Tax=Medicago truncatula TaxID=3880 RepID=A0A072UAG0_MEDTR|nr:hypothetical protein MTR_6g065425 [Medicago truncatula]